MTLSVLHLANHCDRGGNVLLAVDLACAQAAAGADVVFARAGGRYAAFLERHGVRHVVVGQSLRVPWRAARAAATLVAHCRARRPDVIHAHMMSGAVLGKLAARLVGVPLVTTVHNSFDRHSGLMRLGDVIVAISHAERGALAARGFPGQRLRVIVNGTLGSPRTAEDRASATTGECSSGTTGQHPCGATGQRPSGATGQRPSGATGQRPSGATPLPPCGATPPPPSVTTLCGLERRKGVHDVIDAFARVAPMVPGWRLVIAGDGPERGALEERAAGTGCADRIDFLGHVDAPMAVLSRSDVFVLASHAEPFGLCILEAREAGCAVIGTRVGGIAEQLDGGRYGALVPPGRPDLLADALRRLMTDPAALRDARRRAREGLDGYGVARMARAYIDLYHAAIRDRR